MFDASEQNKGLESLVRLVLQQAQDSSSIL